MTEESNALAVPRRATIYLYFLTPYFVSVGVLYLWGFWSTFSVNILEYLSITDVIRLTAYPIISAFATFIVGAIIGESTFGPSLPSGGGRNSRIILFLRKILPILTIVYLLGTVTLMLSNIPTKWYALPALVGWPLAFFAKERGFLIGLIPSDSMRTVVLFLLATLPIFAYGQGRIEANKIIDGRKFDYVLSSIDQVSVAADASPIQRIRYLGHAGDFFFYLNPTNSAVVITKFKDDRALAFKHFDLAEETPAKK